MPSHTNMAVIYKTNEYTPVFKFRSSPSMTTAVEAWTPTTSTRIVLTDFTVSSAAAGTVQIRFGNVGGAVIAEFVLAGSATVGRAYETPVESLVADRSIFAESGMNGLVSITLNGYED